MAKLVPGRSDYRVPLKTAIWSELLEILICHIAESVICQTGYALACIGAVTPKRFRILLDQMTFLVTGGDEVRRAHAAIESGHSLRRGRQDFPAGADDVA